MPLPVLRGRRLELRPASDDHLGFFTDLNSRAEVMAHVSGQPASPETTEAEWVRRLGPRSAVDRGLGYWVGHADGRPVGWWGLGVTETDAGAGELGFRLLPEHWRRGYGAEGARTLVDHAFSTLGLDRVWAGTVTANTASRRTLVAAGLEQTEEPVPGVLTYEATRLRWLSSRD